MFCPIVESVYVSTRNCVIGLYNLQFEAQLFIFSFESSNQGEHAKFSASAS